MSLLDEDLTPTDDDTTFSEIFGDPDPTPEVETLITKNEESSPKKRGRPSKKKEEPEQIVEESTPKKRGRPSKKKEEVIDDEVIEQPKKVAKRVSVDDLPSETLESIFEHYSKKPANELAAKLNISEKHLKKTKI